jgi:hypothetical protein
MARIAGAIVMAMLAIKNVRFHKTNRLTPCRIFASTCSVQHFISHRFTSCFQSFACAGRDPGLKVGFWAIRAIFTLFRAVHAFGLSNLWNQN